MPTTTSILGELFTVLPKEIPLILAGVVSVNVLMANADPAAKKQAVMDLVNNAITGVENASNDEYKAQVVALAPDIDKIVDGLTGIFTTRGIFGFGAKPAAKTA